MIAALLLLVGYLGAPPASAGEPAALPAYIVSALKGAGAVVDGGVVKAPDGKRLTIDPTKVEPGVFKFTDFTGWKLENISFHDLDMSHTTWDNSTSDGVSWLNTNLDHSHWTDAKLIDVDMATLDIKEATFLRTKAHGIQMQSVHFQECILDGSELDAGRSNGKGPNNFLIDVTVERGSARGLKVTNAEILNFNVKDVANAATIGISQSLLHADDVMQLAAGGVKDLPGNAITGTWGPADGNKTVRKLNLSGSSLNEFSIRNVTFEDCNLGALSVNADHKATIRNVKIVGGSLNNTNLSGVDARNLQILMPQEEVKGFSMSNADCEGCVVSGKFRDGDFSYSRWNKSNLKDLRAAVAHEEPKPGEFYVYLGGGVLEDSIAPKESRQFDYEGTEFKKGTEIPADAKFVDSRMHNMNIEEAKVGPRMEVVNCVATKLKSSGVTYENLKILDSDLAESKFDKSVFQGQSTKFDGSIMEETSFKDITLQGQQRFSIAAWIRSIFIKWGWISPSASVTFNGARIQGEIDFTGSRTVGENQVLWRGAVAEPGAAVVLDNRAQARRVVEDMTDGGVAMDRVQIEYSTGNTGKEVLKPATNTADNHAFAQKESQRRNDQAKAVRDFYTSALAERAAEQARQREAIREAYPKSKVR